MRKAILVVTMPPSTNPFKQLEHSKPGEPHETFLSRRKVFYCGFYKQWSFQQFHTTQNYRARLRKESGRNPCAEVSLQANLTLIVNPSLNEDNLYTSIRITLAHHQIDNGKFHDDALNTTTNSEQSIPPSLLD